MQSLHSRFCAGRSCALKRLASNLKRRAAVQVKDEQVTARDKVLAWLEAVDAAYEPSMPDSAVMTDLLQSTSRPSSPQLDGQDRLGSLNVDSVADASNFAQCPSQMPADRSKRRSVRSSHRDFARTLQAKRNVKLWLHLAGEPPHPDGPIRHKYKPCDEYGNRLLPSSRQPRHYWAERKTRYVFFYWSAVKACDLRAGTLHTHLSWRNVAGCHVGAHPLQRLAAA